MPRHKKVRKFILNLMPMRWRYKPTALRPAQFRSANTTSTTHDVTTSHQSSHITNVSKNPRAAGAGSRGARASRLPRPPGGGGAVAWPPAPGAGPRARTHRKRWMTRCRAIRALRTYSPSARLCTSWPAVGSHLTGWKTKIMRTR